MYVAHNINYSNRFGHLEFNLQHVRVLVVSVEGSDRNVEVHVQYSINAILCTF